jgi:hypothetical protein
MLKATIRTVRVATATMAVISLVLFLTSGVNMHLFPTAIWGYLVTQTMSKNIGTFRFELKLAALVFSTTYVTTVYLNHRVWDTPIAISAVRTLFDSYSLAISVAVSWLLYWRVRTTRISVKTETHTSTQRISTADDDVPMRASPKAVDRDIALPSDDNYARALQEYDSGDRQQGLYARLYADSHGNDNKTRANYLQIRARQLHSKTEQPSSARLPTVVGADFDVRSLPHRGDLASVIKATLADEEIRRGFRCYSLPNAMYALHYGKYFLLYRSADCLDSAIEAATHRKHKVLDDVGVIGYLLEIEVRH